jgi:hypothetical protein
MAVSWKMAGLLLALITIPLFAQTPDFSWSWQEQEVIGHNDASIGNTSKLTESERATLLDAIVQRLQKPMSQAGYDDDRIREIASTTRVRFVDMGSGKPLIFTTSLGMEGGCDPLGNCPLWIFRRTADGFTSVLDAIAASYTLQSTDGPRDLILMHHVSAKESGLQLYRLDDGELKQAGCYVALWPTPSDDPTQVSDPTYKACDPGNSEAAPPTEADTKPETPAAADAKQITPDQKQETPVNNPERQAKPDAETKSDAPPAQPESKADAAGQTPDVKPTSPDAPQSQAGDAKPPPQDQGQSAAQNNQVEPRATPESPDAKPDAPADQKPTPPDSSSSDEKPTPPDAPPPSDSKPAAPDAPQSDSKQPAPDAAPTAPAPDTPAPSDQKPAAPDTSQSPSDQKPTTPDTAPSDQKPTQPDAPQSPPPQP